MERDAGSLAFAASRPLRVPASLMLLSLHLQSGKRAWTIDFGGGSDNGASGVMVLPLFRALAV